MSMLLLADLAQEKAASNRRVAQSVETAARRLNAPRQSQEDLGRRVTNTTREALRYTLMQAGEARNLWQSTLTLLQDGLEGNESRELLHTVLEAIDSWFGLMKSTRELWQTAGRLRTSLEGLDDLDAAQRDVEVLKNAAAQMSEFLSRPRPAIDASALARARQVVAQGGYKSPEAVRARLDANRR
jgi:hypothetical protein